MAQRVGDTAGPLLLFLVYSGLCQCTAGLVNTRCHTALLWRGVDRRGLSPIVLGLVDIGVALFILVMLSAVMILGIQLFNAAAVFGVRESIDPAIIDAAVFLNPARYGIRDGESGNAWKSRILVDLCDVVLDPVAKLVASVSRLGLLCPGVDSIKSTDRSRVAVGQRRRIASTPYPY